MTTSNITPFTEPLLNEEDRRLVVFPINKKYSNIWELYQNMMAAFWTPHEISWEKDKYDFKEKLNEDEQKFIKYVLAFFSASDTIVNNNITDLLVNRITQIEVSIAYRFQMMIEDIHAQTYSLQIENIIDDLEERKHILNAIETIPCIKNKTRWMQKWSNENTDVATALVAQAIAEGVFFSGSFCAIFWLKRKNIMPGLISSNELIARDEGMHTDMSVMLYHDIENKLSEEKVHDMFLEALEIEKDFICDSLSCELLGMNATLMEEYVKYVADGVLVSLGYNKIWNAKNPFSWMESISVEGKTNFFEHRPTQYQRADVNNKTKNTEFKIDEDDF